MAQDMSTFFTGMRRNPLNCGPKARTAVRSGAAPGGATPRAVGPTLAASRNRWLQSGAGVAVGAGAAAGAGAGGRAGAGTRAGAVAGPGPGAPFNRRRAVTTRLTGGGPAPSIDIFQSTNTLRRQQSGALPPARNPLGAPRRFREIEWIMKPSKTFVQCSESSSEDNFPDRLREMQRLQDKTGKRRSSWSSGISSASENTSRENMVSAQSTQQQVNLPKTSCRPMGQVSQLRTKMRSSRVFCVPDQRIMHSDELLQAQMLQMHSRKIKSPQRYSYTPVPTPTHVQGSPSVSPSRASPSRKASEEVLTASQIQANPYLEPPTGLISCSTTPIASPKASQAHVQPPSKKQSLCSLDKPTSSSPSTSLSSSSCPSQILIAKPAPGIEDSSNNSSLSSSGTECSAERVVQRYRGAGGGSKAVKLTSTVIKIMPNKASRTSQRASKGRVGQYSRIKLRSKTTSQFLQKGSKDPAVKQVMNAPINQSIAPPPVSMPKVKVSKPIVSQSVSHVVNQLTAQLKKAVGADCKSGPAQRQPATATKGKWPRKLGKKTSIYLLMDQAKPDQTRDEPSSPSRKNDWVIQPMKQQMISPATDQPKVDQRDPAGSDRVNPYMSETKEAVGHNYDIYLNTPGEREQSRGGDPVIGRYNPDPRTQARQPMIPSLQRNNTLHTPSQLSLKPGSMNPSRNTFQGQNRCQPRRPYHLTSERSLRSRRQSLMSQPVSLNRISRPRVPAVPVLQPQPKQVQQQVEEVTGAAGKIVRKTQHKVPRTMEDGIDMSYQYFVSLPLKRGRKPQVVRYLYRPMVRHLNGQPSSGGRRSSKRAKRRRAAAGAASAQAALASEDSEQSQQLPKELDPELVALGGAPLPLENPPVDEEETSQPKEGPTIIFDPEEALNSPYHVPPLKLKSCYMTMLEELEQMPYPDERLNRRRRNQRRARAAGGFEQFSPPEYEDQPLQGIGGGDDKKQGTPVIVWSGRTAPSVPRTTVVNYQAKPTRVNTTTGAPMVFHQPLRLTLKEVDCRPMIRTITYESIEEEEQEELERLKRKQLDRKLEQEQLEMKVEQLQLKPKPEKEQLERERLAWEQLERKRLTKEQIEKMQLERKQQDLEEYQPQDPMDQSEPMETGQETSFMAKSVSFHPEPVIVNRGSTSAIQSSSTSSIGSKSKSKKRKTKKSHAKGKGKNRSKGKGKGKGRK